MEKLENQFVLIFPHPVLILGFLGVYMFFRFFVFPLQKLLICTLFCMFGFEEAFLWIIISHDDDADDDDVQGVLGVTGFLLRHC